MLSSSEASVQITNALEKLIDSGISLGERVLGALIIFIVGKFLVNWLNRLFARILEKRIVDASIQSFLKSMVNILLLIMLILAVIGKLGIELTGFAALLASAGVAIGMALSGNLQNFAGGLIILLFRPYKVGDYIDAGSGLKVVSLYGKKKKPQPEDLSGIDVMIFDMQDVGVRFYTYLSKLHYVMEA